MLTFKFLVLSITALRWYPLQYRPSNRGTLSESQSLCP